VAKAAGLPVVLSLTDFWFLCPRMTLLRGDQENCDGKTTAWECIRCLAHDAKVYRWPRAVMPDAAVGGLLMAVARVPGLTRVHGLRGMVGDMAGRKAFLLEMFRAADRRITASPFVRDCFRACGFDSPIRVQPYGHDLAWLTAEPKSPSDRIRIGFIGQVAPYKGVHLLLEALRALEPAIASRIEIQVYGDPTKLPDYGRRLAELAATLPQISFLGTYAHDTSAGIFARMDVLAVPSLWYDFPIIIHEAFASGTPVLATHLGGMAETVLDGVNGLLFRRGDVGELAGLLRRLVVEPGLLARLRGGIGPVKTMAQEASDLECVYDESRALCGSDRPEIS
jgi:glycosyltransferase involved in cell wall biosynthesis